MLLMFEKEENSEIFYCLKMAKVQQEFKKGYLLASSHMKLWMH